MSTRRIAGALGAGLLVLAACQPAAPGPLSQADTDAIRAVSDSFATLVRARDWEALSQLYTEDAVLMPPYQPAVNGRAAIRDWGASLPPVTDLSFALTAIEGRGDLAYVRGRYFMTMEGMATDTGKFIEIRERGADGMWRLSGDIFNSDRPPAPPPAPAPARRR